MGQDHRPTDHFLLRLPLSVREQATERASDEGTSLNHFISLAVAEKLARLEAQATRPPQTTAAHLGPTSHLLFKRSR